MEKFSNLNHEDIQALSIEMKICYFIQPWNSGINPSTFEEWASKIGFLPFIESSRYIDSDDYDLDAAIEAAKDTANSLYEYLITYILPSPN